MDDAWSCIMTPRNYENIQCVLKGGGGKNQPFEAWSK